VLKNKKIANLPNIIVTLSQCANSSWRRDCLLDSIKLSC